MTKKDIIKPMTAINISLYVMQRRGALMRKFYKFVAMLLVTSFLFSDIGLAPAFAGSTYSLRALAFKECSRDAPALSYEKHSHHVQGPSHKTSVVREARWLIWTWKWQVRRLVKLLLRTLLIGTINPCLSITGLAMLIKGCGPLTLPGTQQVVSTPQVTTAPALVNMQVSAGDPAQINLALTYTGIARINVFVKAVKIINGVETALNPTTSSYALTPGIGQQPITILLSTGQGTQLTVGPNTFTVNVGYTDFTGNDVTINSYPLTLQVIDVPPVVINNEVIETKRAMSYHLWPANFLKTPEGRQSAIDFATRNHIGRLYVFADDLDHGSVMPGQEPEATVTRNPEDYKSFVEMAHQKGLEVYGLVTTSYWTSSGESFDEIIPKQIALTASVVNTGFFDGIRFQCEPYGVEPEWSADNIQYYVDAYCELLRQVRTITAAANLPLVVNISSEYDGVDAGGLGDLVRPDLTDNLTISGVGPKPLGWHIGQNADILNVWIQMPGESITDPETIITAVEGEAMYGIPFEITLELAVPPSQQVMDAVVAYFRGNSDFRGISWCLAGGEEVELNLQPIDLGAPAVSAEETVSGPKIQAQRTEPLRVQDMETSILRPLSLSESVNLTVN